MGIAKLIKNHFSRSIKQSPAPAREDNKSSFSSRRMSLSPIRSNTRSSSAINDFEYTESNGWREQEKEEFQDESFEEGRCFSPQLPLLSMNKRVRFDVLSDAVSRISEVTIYEDPIVTNDEEYEQGHQNNEQRTAANFRRYGTFRKPIKISNADNNEKNGSPSKEVRSTDAAKSNSSNSHGHRNENLAYVRRTLPKLPASSLNRRRSCEPFADTVSRISERTLYEESVQSNEYDEITENFTEIHENEDPMKVAPSIIFVRYRNRRCQRCYKTITKKVIFV